MRFLKFLLPLAGVAIMFTGSAAAHVTVNPDEAAAGSWFRATLRVSHGCEGSPTVAVRVKLPDGVFSVKPQVKPGWTIEIKTRKLAQPAEGPHGIVTEVVDEITWRGGPLPDAYFDEFGLSMKLPNEPEKILYFSTTQECEKGVNLWTEIPPQGRSWGDIDKPAPYLILRPAEKTGHSGH